jgi:hypothetical protein
MPLQRHRKSRLHQVGWNIPKAMKSRQLRRIEERTCPTAAEEHSGGELSSAPEEPSRRFKKRYTLYGVRVISLLYLVAGAISASQQTANRSVASPTPQALASVANAAGLHFDTYFVFRGLGDFPVHQFEISTRLANLNVLSLMTYAVHFSITVLFCPGTLPLAGMHWISCGLGELKICPNY